MIVLRKYHGGSSAMYKVEKNEKIGEYIGKLISRKFGRDRQFAIAYIKLRDRLEDEPDSDEIQRVANKVCQIKKGGKGIEMVVKNDCKAAAKMLKNALKHNKDVLKTLKKIANISEKSFGDIAQYMDDKTIQKSVMREFHFYDENDTVAFHTRIIKAENFQGLFSNVIRVNVSSKDKYVMSLIEDVNASYDQIKNFDYREV